jgi:hypothetical protein
LPQDFGTMSTHDSNVDSSESEHEDSHTTPIGKIVDKDDTIFEAFGALRSSFREPVQSETWLSIPDEMMNPKKMCAVNQFVHIVSEPHPDFLPYIEELVLIHHGPTIPEHFRSMVQCINIVNSASSIKGSFIPIEGVTSPVDVQVGKGKSKKFDVIGISRLVRLPPNTSAEYLDDFISTSEKQENFRTKCNSISTKDNKACFAHVNNVNMYWGFIPVQYERGGLQRKLFQVLKIIPQPGFNLIDFLRRNYFEKKNETKHREYAKITEMCNLLQNVVNYEADFNFGMKGTWDNSLPNPWMVEDATNATSVQRLLSPFSVLRRILQHIQGGYSGLDSVPDNEFQQDKLIIDGFPSLQSAEDATDTLCYFETLQEIYLKGLRVYRKFFYKNASIFAENLTDVYRVPSFLSDQNQCFDCVPTKLNMIFCLENFRENDRICIPKLGLAIIDIFLIFETSQMFANMNTLDFIVAHVGELMTTQVVTVSEIAKKYKLNVDMQSLEDFPRAGLHKSSRDTFKRNAKKMLETQQDKDVISKELALFYESYLRLQYTATTNGLLMDSWMSDRVYRSALLLDQLVGSKDPCINIRNALFWAHSFRSGSNKLYNQMTHNRCAFVWHRINLAFCKFNESIKANPMNLALIWGMLKGDILTFAGLHNQTWRWMMYCMQIAPCWGHLRTLTEDGHAARSECTLTAKPNSVGLNEVVIKATNYCLVDLLGYVVNMNSEDYRVLQLDKVDRKTRVSIESGHSCEFANNKLINKPSPGSLMQAAAIDEALRTFDESGLAGLINTGLPRDSNAGQGTTTKCLKPQNGYMEKGETRQLPGMGFYALCFATNTNARNPAIAEMLRTLACGAMITYAPGCPDTPGLSTAITIREKRKRGQSQKSSQCTGESMMPMDPDICSKLAYIFSIGGMYSRHIALINKTAQSNWEISYPVLLYLNLMQELFIHHFSSWISGNYVQSASRQFKGVIARGVASCLFSTVVGNMEFFEDKDSSNFNALLQMENSALSLYWANVVLLNGFTHLIDSSIYLVSQLIKWKLRVPVLDFNFLCSFLDPDAHIDTECEDYKNLHLFLTRLRSAKLRDSEMSSNDPIKHFTGSYVQVEGVGSQANYNQIEKYFSQYCGINIGSQHTYLKIFKDAAHRSLDLTNVLDLPYSMMDIRIFFRRCNISYEDHWYVPPGGNHEKGINFLILIEDKADIKGLTTVGTVWVHVSQILLLASLLGNCELHSDNSIQLGKEIFKLMAKQYLPMQAVPSKAILCETFKTQYGEVVGDIFSVTCNRDYFFRHRLDFNAWKTGVSKDAKIVANHPLEDVIHIHAWVQVHYMLVGVLPTKFYYIPLALQRPPELVPGRIYPLICEDMIEGTVRVAPNGKSHTHFRYNYDDKEKEDKAISVDWMALYFSLTQVQIAPLIYRKHAVVVLPDKSFHILQPQQNDANDYLPDSELCETGKHAFKMYPDIESENYLNVRGEYWLGGDTFLHWKLAEEYLLPLGTHLAIYTIALWEFISANNLKYKLPPGDFNYAVGWLRYPDECDINYGDNNFVFIAIRVASFEQDFDDVLIVSIKPDDVFRKSDILPGNLCVDYLIPVE